MDQVHVVKVILCFTISKISIFREIWIAFFLLFHFSPTCPVEMNKPPENMHQNIALQDTKTRFMPSYQGCVRQTSRKYRVSDERANESVRKAPLPST